MPWARPPRARPGRSSPSLARNHSAPLLLPASTSGVSELAELRDYWDQDAATYDQWPEHGARSKAERAAWAATLTTLLPPVGARVLDVGAGTGFLSLAAARLGYEVTALDIAPRMLARLKDEANREGLTIDVVCGPAHEPPPGPFDAVMQRLLMWTLPEPVTALRAWLERAPNSRLLAFEAVGTGRLGALRTRAWNLARRAGGLPPEHHAPYSRRLRSELGLASRTPEAFVGFIEQGGWRDVEIMPLDAVKFGRRLRQRRLGRLVGVTQEYVLAASSPRVVET